MSLLTDVFPEIYRYRAQDAGRVRLISGLAAALALCGATGYSIGRTGGSWRDYLSAITYMQFNMLVFYGTLCAAKSITQEKADRTWDFQRLTPLSSFEITAGKFLGAPVYAWFLFACLLPAAVLALLLGPGIAADFFNRYALGLSVGLLASAYDDTGGSGMGYLSGPLVGLAGITALNASFRYADTLTQPASALYRYAAARPEPGVLEFYGLRLSPDWCVVFAAVSCLVFAAWAFLGAKCRVGGDLLERRRAWRLPAFLVFLALYIAGSEYGPARGGTPPLTSQLLPVLAACMAAFLSGERREYWRRWLEGENPARRLDDTPSWIKGAAAVSAIAAVLYLTCGLGELGAKPFTRLYFILPLFLLRDLMFLQWCRFSAARRPEMMALACLALAYALPAIILGPTGMHRALSAFLPYAQAEIGAGANLAGPLAQVLLMGYVLSRKIRTVLTEEV